MRDCVADQIANGLLHQRAVNARPKRRAGGELQSNRCLGPRRLVKVNHCRYRLPQIDPVAVIQLDCRFGFGKKQQALNDPRQALIFLKARSQNILIFWDRALRNTSV